MTTTLTPRLEDQIESLSDQVAFLVAEAEERRALKESLTSLTSDLNPIAGQGMESLGRALAELEQRGYVDFARGGAGVIDRIVSSFTQSDIEALGDNVVLILETVKEMTQPEVMRMLQATFHNVSAAEIDEPPSLFGLLREMRDPEVRRGLARLIAVVKVMGEPDSKTEMRKEQPN